MLPTNPDYVRYSPDVEVGQPDETEKTEQVVKIMLEANRKNCDRHRHAIRDAHAKNHGVVVGELQVHPELLPHLAQGLFATPASHPVVIRFSSNPGDIGDDKVPTPRGMAVTVVGLRVASCCRGMRTS